MSQTLRLFHHLRLEMLGVENPWADNWQLSWGFLWIKHGLHPPVVQTGSNRFNLPWTSKHFIYSCEWNATVCWLMGGRQRFKHIACWSKILFLHRNGIYEEPVQIKRSIDHQVNHDFPNGVTWSSTKSVAWSSNATKYLFFRWRFTSQTMFFGHRQGNGPLTCKILFGGTKPIRQVIVAGASVNEMKVL